MKLKNELKKINFFNPLDWYRFFSKIRFVSFLLVGGTGVLLNLTIVTVLTEFFLGRELYFYSYLIGLFSNLTYNFILFTKITFKTKKNHKKRYVVYITYSLIMSFIQAITVRHIVNVVGVDFYLIVIASIIFVFSIINFMNFKLWLFKD